MAKITIFDTTLRDGEQSPGSTMTPPEKLRLAHQLAALGVDVIEAGFPIASLDDFASVRRVARDVRGPVVAALSRAREDDIDRAAEALEGAHAPRIHTFIATSDIHLERKLRIGREECLDRTGEAVERAKGYVDNVEFSAEDAMRTDVDFLSRVVKVAIQAGATTVNLPDTVGYAFPAEIVSAFRAIRERVPALGTDVALSAHCHDDLGMAVANSLAAIDAGATQVECTINGIGERAGNAALEEIVMALHVRRDRADHFTGVNPAELYAASQLLAEITGIHPQPNKAIVGDNAFAHEAGIHQDGMIKDRSTYEIMTPESVGAPPSRLVLGKHSGRHALRHRYAQLGYEVDEATLERAYQYCTLLAEQKITVRDEDLVSVFHRGALQPEARPLRIESIHVSSRGPSAHARIEVITGDGEPREVEGTGREPLGAVFAAMAGLVDVEVAVQDVSIRAPSSGRDPVGEVRLACAVDGRTFSASAASADVLEAAARAFLGAVTKAEYATELEAAELAKHADQWAM